MGVCVFVPQLKELNAHSHHNQGYCLPILIFRTGLTVLWVRSTDDAIVQSALEKKKDIYSFIRLCSCEMSALSISLLMDDDDVKYSCYGACAK